MQNCGGRCFANDCESWLDSWLSNCTLCSSSVVGNRRWFFSKLKLIKTNTMWTYNSLWFMWPSWQWHAQTDVISWRWLHPWPCLLTQPIWLDLVYYEHWTKTFCVCKYDIEKVIKMFFVNLKARKHLSSCSIDRIYRFFDIVSVK